MRNPAVTKLVKNKIGGLGFWMDDNIGESIHIHLADFRLDLSVEELHTLSNELTEVIAEQICVEGFDVHRIDPVFLSGMLAPLLPHLERVVIDEVDLGDLLVAYGDKWGFFTKYRHLKDGRAVKALHGDPRENDDIRGSHHIGQTSAERLSSMQESIRDNGYPVDGQYIILFNDQMLVRDGQHRASCLYYDRGNVKVPVMRLYFDKDCDVSYIQSYFAQFLKKIREVRPHDAARFFRRLFRYIIRFVRNGKKKLFFLAKRKKIMRMEKVFFRNA